MEDDASMDALFLSLPDALVSGAAQAPPQETHHEPELQDLRQQLNYKNAEATNLRTNLAAVQSELTAAKLAAARGAISGGGRHDGEASRLRREIQQLRTKLEFAEQARREMQHLPTVPQALQRRTTAVQTDRAEHHPCVATTLHSATASTSGVAPKQPCAADGSSSKRKRESGHEDLELEQRMGQRRCHVVGSTRDRDQQHQRNIHIFRKLLVGHCGAFLELLRLGGNETGPGGSGLHAGTAASAACTGVPNQVQVLAQRLYGCISSVIAGDVHPGSLISVLEEFMLLDVCQKAPVTHALRALRIVLLCLPDVHLTMVREVNEQLRAMVPGFAGANEAFSIQNPRQYDCRPAENRIWDTDPRQCASKLDTRRHSEQKLFRSALKVAPRLIHSFCKSDASEWEVAMHFAAILNVLLRRSLPATMELDGFLALCLPLKEASVGVATANRTPLCVLDNMLHGDNHTCVKKTAAELCLNLYRHPALFRLLQRFEPAASDSTGETQVVRMFDEVVTMLRSQEADLRQRAIHILWYVVENYPAIDGVTDPVSMVHGITQCVSGLDTLLAHNRQRQLMLHQRLVLVLHDTVERISRVDASNGSQQTTTLVTSTEQALQLFVRVVSKTGSGELRAALMPYVIECVAVVQFFGAESTDEQPRQRSPWDQQPWQSRAAALQAHSSELNLVLTQLGLH